VSGRKRVAVLVIAAALAAAGCGSAGDGGGDEPETLANGRTGPITYVTGKDTAGWVQPTLDRWNRLHPDQSVTLIELPETADLQRNQMVANLRARSDRYSILSTDVVWTAEFAKSGWLEEIPRDQFPEFSGFAKGPVGSCQFEGKTWCVPAAADGGLLYYRKDVLDREHRRPPKTWAELEDMATTIAPKYGLDGYFGQHSMYEGLTVNAAEAIWSAGGDILAHDGKDVVVNSPQARAGIGTLQRGFRDGWIPRAAVTYMEEPARRRFQAGRALFMRQWPYAYSLMQKDPAIAGRFDVAPLPGPSALGGHNHAISRFTRNKKTALEFLKFISTTEQQRFRLEHSTAPVTQSLYDDPRFQEQFPYLKVLGQSIASARNRPITPYYNDVHQAIEEAIYPVEQGQKSVDDALRELEVKLKAVIAAG